MAKMVIRLEYSNGEPVEIPFDEIVARWLTRLSLLVDGDPVVSIPFHVHEGGALHTICRRYPGDTVEAVEL